MTFSPETDNSALVGELLNSKVKISGKAPENNHFLLKYLFTGSHFYY